MLPASERLVDYRMRMEELLGSLGVLEKRYAVEILNEMLALPSTNGTAKHSVSEAVEAAG